MTIDTRMARLSGRDGRALASAAGFFSSRIGAGGAPAPAAPAGRIPRHLARDAIPAHRATRQRSSRLRWSWLSRSCGLRARGPDPVGSRRRLALAGAGARLPCSRHPCLSPVVRRFSATSSSTTPANYMAMLDRALFPRLQHSRVSRPRRTRRFSSTPTPRTTRCALLPLGVGHTLLRVDALWLWQPYLDLPRRVLALPVQLVGTIVRSHPHALDAAVGAQAALIYGYALWGGIRSSRTALDVVTLVCLVPAVFPAPGCGGAAARGRLRRTARS